MKALFLFLFIGYGATFGAGAENPGNTGGPVPQEMGQQATEPKVIEPKAKVPKGTEPKTTKPKAAREQPLFTWDLLWTGSWYNSVKIEDGETPPAEDVFSDGTLYNRGDLTLTLPALDLSFRFLATDKRLVPFRDDDNKAGFNPGLAAYHNTSGSRFLHGVQSEYGLPARINNVWLRSAPFMESRQPSSRDLKTEPAAKDKSETYLYLGLPQNILPTVNAFASTAIDENFNPAFGSGIGYDKGGTEFRLEGFYTQKKLPPRKVSTWFSSSPPLPERDFNIIAFAAFFNSPLAAFATDWAFSETYAWGEGIYGNFALRLGNKPWRFSLASDWAGSRFADRGGSTAGAGFRLSAKTERFWPRSGLLRFQGTIRSPGLEEDLNRGNLSIYFRPSAPSAAAKRNNPFLVRFSRASLGISRDARNPLKTADNLDALFGLNFGPFSSVFSFHLHSLSVLDQKSEAPPLFSSPFYEAFDSFKVSGELGWKLSNFPLGAMDIKTRVGYTTRANKEPIWDLSYNCSVRPGKWGRIGLKIASTDFPEKWNYTLSWRFSYSDKF